MNTPTNTDLHTESGEYKYAGIPLQPSIFAEILVHLFNGKRFKREQAIEAVRLYHQEHGGSLDHFSGPGVFKKAASYLKGQGLTNIKYGYWILENQHDAPRQDTISEPPIFKNSSSPTDTSTGQADQADEVIGQGDAAVYVYYFDAYQEKALHNGKTYWPCKIGRTDIDPLSRIYGQSRTCFPEAPHIALIIKTDDSSTLETTLHCILKSNDRQLADAPGAEWFNTNPEEIKALYDILCQITSLRPLLTSIPLPSVDYLLKLGQLIYMANYVEKMVAHDCDELHIRISELITASSSLLAPENNTGECHTSEQNIADTGLSSYINQANASMNEVARQCEAVLHPHPFVSDGLQTPDLHHCSIDNSYLCTAEESDLEKAIRIIDKSFNELSERRP